ncbi:MAG TPA: glycosyltransferase [Ligilactobacillus salivarius]|uniref:Glycosyltransferase n=1 Tax=Ligilactobacillus salivarius TaxID=1624 RepID=A0A921IBF3_9LACO|nr:glycosyltransferase family 2 protein [Ligilactobacillus salivarius]HJG15133.1 glycosyltransferase [Ligilactobacillus salivarius]
MVKVSIGIPIYNVEEYLRECLDSIMNQTFKNFEVIMVDDGSTDNSFNICQEFAARDSRFKLIHQANIGVAGARNTCLKHMKGEYISWVDSDDKVEPNYLERLLEVQNETQADLVDGYNYGFKDGMRYYYDLTHISPTLDAVEISKEELFLRLLEGFRIVLWGNLAKKELYQGVYFITGKNYEDNGTRFKLYFRANKIVILPEPLYGYREERKGSIMTNKNTSETLRKKLQDFEDITANSENFIYFMDISQSKEIVEKIHQQYLGHLYSLSKTDLEGQNEEKYENYTTKYRNRWQKILE